MNKIKFSWTYFYQEFAQVLLEYENNRVKLIDKLKNAFKKINIDLPTLEKGNNIIDIDPFTIFGLFNKSKLKEENRLNIIKSLKEEFNVLASVPMDFEGVGVLNNQNAVFYRFVNERDADDIDDLWNLFKSAIQYAQDKNLGKKDKLIKYFDLVINKKGIGNSKLTMGLYWIQSDAFLNFDSRSKWYIYETDKLPQDLRDSLPELDDKLTGSEYFQIIDLLQNYFNDKDSLFKNFRELSLEAWNYSEYVNEQNKKKTTIVKLTDKNFLEDAYLDNPQEIIDLLKYKSNIILCGAPGVGKTFVAKKIAYHMMGEEDEKRVMMVQFHQSYSYEDFMEGFRPNPNGEGFILKKGVFYNFCLKALEDKEHDYFFIIDEINRGNVSQILGSLFMLIEKDKRGISLPLLYLDEEFKVPDNLYIIGTMNTADRSLTNIDYALRRRFGFYQIPSLIESDKFNLYKKKLNSKKFDKLIDVVISLNKVIVADDDLGEDFQIGHSYFCNLEEVNDRILKNIVLYELIPLLKEYWFDNEDKLNIWCENLRSVIK
ncbi:MAG: AAA family ATPase [Bacilli bacterium]|nr:AAA family ATPase [Bacilli bacterium]